MKRFQLQVEYIFKGIYEVVAENEQEAKKLINEQCGLVLGRNLHTLLEENKVDWNFPMHPEKRILSVKLKK